MQLLDIAQSAQRVYCILVDSFQTWDDLSHENREGWMRVAKFMSGLGETIDGTPFKDLGTFLWDEFSGYTKGAEPAGQLGRLVWEGLARHLGALMDDAIEDEIPLGTLEESWLEWFNRQKAQRPHLSAIAGS